ncbi:MAG TPA: hypothetical protein VKY92_18315 [Verrucomicrobiae bacterium]|nr:hypothetical protein [Verrucomicrobiae bacterium]
MLFSLALAWAPVPRACAQGSQQPRRALELSETNTAEILTNLNQLTIKKDGLKELDDQLREINSFSKGKLFESRFNMPYNAPRALPNKTIKELIDRKNNWNLSPEELGTGLSSMELDAISKFREDGSDSKGSSLQQFYDALNHSSQAQNSNAKPQKKASDQGTQSGSRLEDDLATFGDDSKLPAGIRDKAETLRNNLSQDPTSVFGRSRGRSSFDNFFGLEPNTKTTTGSGTKTSVDSFLEQFKKAMDGPSFSGIDPGLRSLLPNDNTSKEIPSVPTIDSLKSTRRHEFTDTTAGQLSTLPNTTVIPDINATILNQWNPLYTPPRLELPKYTPPTPPNMEFPRRKF